MMGLYADPRIYDILYSPDTAREVSVLERIEKICVRGPLRPPRRWFEPACGTGRYLRVAQGRGRQVWGFDRDPGQLEYARRRLRCPPGRTFEADMAGFRKEALAARLKKGSVDFAFNPVNSIRHLVSDRAMLAHLKDMAWILKPGAVYVVGISLTDYGRLQHEEDVWEGARGRCRVSQVVNYLPPEPGSKRARAETVVSHLTVTRPRGIEHFDDRYDLRCYDRGQWRALIGRSALEHLESIDAFGDPAENRILNYQLEVLGGS